MTKAFMRSIRLPPSSMVSPILSGLWGKMIFCSICAGATVVKLFLNLILQIHFCKFF